MTMFRSLSCMRLQKNVSFLENKLVHFSQSNLVQSHKVLITSYRENHNRINPGVTLDSDLLKSVQPNRSDYHDDQRKGGFKKFSYKEKLNRNSLQQRRPVKKKDMLSLYNIELPVVEDLEDVEERLFEKTEAAEREKRGRSARNPEIRVMLLTKSVTPEMEESIISGNQTLRYILKQVLIEIEALEKRRLLKPLLPDSLSLNEWKTMIKLTDYRSRVSYLCSLKSGTETLENIQAMDQVYSEPLQIDQQLIDQVVGNDKTAERNLKIFLMEHELLRQEGVLVPYVVRERDLAEITQLKTQTSRMNYIDFMNTNEMRNFFAKLNKEAKNSELSKARLRMAEEKKNSSHLTYALSENTIFLRLQRGTVNHHQYWNGIREFNDWGLPLIIDLSHSSNYKIDRHRKQSLLRELMYSISFNKNFKTPFQLHMTGVDEEVKSGLSSYYPQMEQKILPFNITEQSHLDMFPHDRLVYLSPDSKNDLVRFDPNDIYVIGGIIDGSQKSPLMLSSAKREKIRHARFPMKIVMGLQMELNIETCVCILNDLKESNDWFYSLRWVPPRALGNRLKNGEPKPEHVLMYRAHKQLCPNTPLGEDIAARNEMLNAKQYRYYYQKIMQCKTREEMYQLLEQLRI